MFVTVVVVCRIGSSVSGSTPTATVSSRVCLPVGPMFALDPHPASRQHATTNAPNHLCGLICVPPLYEPEEAHAHLRYPQIPPCELVPVSSSWRRSGTELAQPVIVEIDPGAVGAELVQHRVHVPHEVEVGQADPDA